jgi:hypothetical protein
MCLGRSSSFVDQPERVLADCSPDLSWIEMTKLIPSLLMRFDVELADASKDPEQHCW